MKPEDIEAYVDAAAKALDLPVAPGHRPGVLHYFALAAGFAELVKGLPLGVHDEPATGFAPVVPATRPVSDSSRGPAGGAGPA